LGVIAMFSAILILLVMPYTDLSKSRGIQFRPLSKIAFYVFVANFLILMQLGAKHVESPFIEFGQISTVLYFSHFLIIVPLITSLENSFAGLSIGKIIYTSLESYLQSFPKPHAFVSLPLQSKVELPIGTILKFLCSLILGLMILVIIFENSLPLYADAEGVHRLNCLCDTCYSLKFANATEAVANLNSNIATLTQDLANASSSGSDTNSIQANIDNIQTQLAAQERWLEALRNSHS